MRELLRSNNLVLLSWIRSVLDGAGIEIFILDTQMSVIEGGANAIPRRVMVGEESHAKAVRVLKDTQSEVDGLDLFDDC